MNLSPYGLQTWNVILKKKQLRKWAFHALHLEESLSPEDPKLQKRLSMDIG
jgi:hypothetical protein